jgi:CDP-diacylglycerol--glycerol-3-phosphate 3-phosphatidyltransferase
MAPVFVILFQFENPYSRIAAFVIFGLASLSDSADGHIARKYRMVTGLGKFLDPLADKILVTTAFITLVALDCAPAWLVALIVAREFYVTGLRSLLANKGTVLSASRIAKIKTGVQMVSITFILLMITLDSFFALYKIPEPGFLRFDHFLVYNILIGLSTIITVYSGIDYTVRYYSVLKDIFK